MKIIFHARITSGLPDGTRVNAMLTFKGHSGSAPAAPDSVQIKGIVESTPSFIYSTIQLPTDPTPKGQQVHIVITAHDGDNLEIQDARGRFFELSIQAPGGAVYRRTATSMLDIPAGRLDEVGEYKVSYLLLICRKIWNLCCRYGSPRHSVLLSKLCPDLKPRDCCYQPLLIPRHSTLSRQTSTWCLQA